MKTKDLPQSALKDLTVLGNQFADNIMDFGISYHSIGRTESVNEMYNRTLTALAYFENCKRQLQGMLKILEEYKETTE